MPKHREGTAWFLGVFSLWWKFSLFSGENDRYMLCLITTLLQNYHFVSAIFPPNASFQPDCHLCVKYSNTPLPVWPVHKWNSSDFPAAESKTITPMARPTAVTLALLTVLRHREAAAGTRLKGASRPVPQDRGCKEHATAECLQPADKKHVWCNRKVWCLCYCLPGLLVIGFPRQALTEQ